MKLGLLGDTMLGRRVATRFGEVGPDGLFDDGVVAVLAEADPGWATASRRGRTVSRGH